MTARMTQTPDSESPTKEVIQKIAEGYFVAMFLLLIIAIGVVLSLFNAGAVLLTLVLLAFGELRLRRWQLRQELDRPMPSSPRLIGVPPPPRRRLVRRPKKVPGPLSKSSVESKVVPEPAASEASGLSSDSADPEEMRRLRAKNAELKAIIAEANDERSALRQQLAEAISGRGQVADVRPPANSSSNERPSAGPNDSAVQGSRAVRKPLIPVYSVRAIRSLEDLPTRIVREELQLIAGLAAGDEAYWQGTKQLVRPEGIVFSARIGIHYRALFEVTDASLHVVDVIHRKELETTLQRLG